MGGLLRALARLLGRQAEPEGESAAELSRDAVAKAAKDEQAPAEAGGGEGYLVFMSGSKPVQAPRTEVERFRSVCRAIGQVLGGKGYGIVGCPAHPSRVLAAQEARKALQELAPDAPFQTGGVQFPLNAQERGRFVRLAKAAVFVGGSEGTVQEFELCMQYGVKPLIPVAGSGGSGHSLAQQLLEDPTGFWEAEVGAEVIKCLANPDETPEAYAEAVSRVLAAHG